MPTSCIVCGAAHHARSRCHSCYVYWRRNGKDRTEAMAVKAAVAEFERRMERRRLARLMAKAS